MVPSSRSRELPARGAKENRQIQILQLIVILVLKENEQEL